MFICMIVCDFVSKRLRWIDIVRVSISQYMQMIATKGIINEITKYLIRYQKNYNLFS